MKELFRESEFSNDSMDFSKIKTDEQPLIPPDMMSMFMEDMKSHKGGNVAPDTEGADYFFITDFVTEGMEWDFDRIEEDFMNHCHNKLRDFGQVQWYTHNEIRYSDPEQSHRSMVMGLILNGAKCGDNYCKALIRYLFKTYHKPLHKQLKRFSKISADEVIGLSDVDGNLDLGYMSVILTMCAIDNITMSDNCGLLFLYLEKRRDEFEKEDEESAEYIDLRDGLFEECDEKVTEWVEEDAGKNPNYRKQLREYWKEDKFVGGCLRHLGYPEDYVYRCMQNNMGVKTQFTRTLSILKTVYPEREFSFDEVQRYTHLYSAISALVDVSDELDDINKTFLGLKEDYDSWDEETWFHKENIAVSTAREPKEEKKVLTNVAKVENNEACRDDYLVEIDELRRKLNHREMEYRKLKAQYSAEHAARREAENLISKYENDREELIALREFAYNLENEVPKIEETSAEEMKEAIKDKSYVIIGGHINWVNKLKQEFPNWEFILPSTYKTVDAGSLDNKEMLFFFTDHISHAAYGKFIALARERKIPFSYLHGVNMEQIIRQIYENGKC